MKYIASHQYLVKDIDYSNSLIKNLINIWSEENYNLKKYYTKMSVDRLNLLIIIDDMESKSVDNNLISIIQLEEERLAEIINRESEELKLKM
jgi:hypothetical protein